MKADIALEDWKLWKPFTLGTSKVGDFILLTKIKGELCDALVYHSEKKEWKRTEGSMNMYIIDIMNKAPRLYNKQYILDAIFEGDFK